MRKNFYAISLIVEALVILVVLILFRVIEDRKIAALIAGCLFIALPSFVIKMSFHNLPMSRMTKFHIAMALQFLIFFAIPIFLLRIFHWREDFALIGWGPLSGTLLHQWSTKSYAIMMIASLLGTIKFQKELVK